MASVKSLGLHQPSGLHYAIDEQLLAPNPPPNSYKWDIISGKSKHTDIIEDELLITKNAVLWCRGGILRKIFKFDLEKESVTKALLAYFPASDDDKAAPQAHSQTTKPSIANRRRPRMEQALVVFLSTQAHIYFLSGASHVVHMPFEVETAFAGPSGVLIQRKQRSENIHSSTLRFPRVIPNSFLSSQLTEVNSSQAQDFSVQSLGNPKALNLGLSNTLESMFDGPMGQVDSHWPRLVSLSDPLLDIGLVVTEPDPQSTKGPTAGARNEAFLDPAEEILYIEQVELTGRAFQQIDETLTIAVTLNRSTNSYNVWRLKYLEYQDPFIKPRKSKLTTTSFAARRRSSMAPSFAESNTPAKPNTRDSFGAPLPGKRHRKSEKIEKPVDFVSSLEKQDKDGSAITRRSSRRLSSMLARADLSASQERSIFSEQPSAIGSKPARKQESRAAPHNRSSSSFSQQIRPSLSSLLEAPLDMGLNEGFLNMGLDDHELDGLQHDVRFTKIFDIPSAKSNVHYTVPAGDAPQHSKVFILAAPAYARDGHDRSQLLIGIQNIHEKRLDIITIQIVLQSTERLNTRASFPSSAPSSLSIATGEIRRAQNVVDSCKLVDGEQSVILILSESMDGQLELSTQAPWSDRTRISPNLVFVDDTRHLQYRGRVVDRDMKQRKSEIFDLTNGSIIGLRHPRQRGVVDAVDAGGRLHQLKIQLEPTCPQVRHVLSVCRNVLQDALGERLHGGWLHIIQWLRDQDETFANIEWSAATLLLFSLVLNLGPVKGKPMQTTRLPVRKRRPASGSFGSIRESDDWKALEIGETASSLGCPVWMMNRGWQWALDSNSESWSANAYQVSSPRFTAKHIVLAREYMASPLGIIAFGPSGYMPTSLHHEDGSRRKAVADIFMALHLLLEEKRLDIMTAEYVSPGRADLRVVLCQIARWLKWYSFSAVYELGIQEVVDEKFDSELNLTPSIPEPTMKPNILEWVQNRLVTQQGNYPSPVDIYAQNFNMSRQDNEYDDRWDVILPRTMMLRRFFKALEVNPTAAEMVETMQAQGLTNAILESLPEAILVPLRDAISLCQPRPPKGWPDDLLKLIKRSDMSSLLSPEKATARTPPSLLTPTHTASWDYRLLSQSVEDDEPAGYDESNGIERQAVIRALFKEDRRLNEAQDLLSTHKSRHVRLNPDSDWPESEYLEKQKQLVSRIATGTLAIPAGRGLLYYSLRFPLITQRLHIGGFNLNCIVRPANVTVGVEKSLFTEEKVCWGFFHQGVAAGLAISPDAKGIDTSWILYNKPGQELSNRHAGFLLALGLNGHLKDVAKWVAFKYLTPKHTMTSIGLLLGLAASYIGTMDSLITRLLSVHATRMLPRGAAELNLSPLTQTTGIMGIGLVYCNSQHRRMSEIMLSEIEHAEDEEEDEPLRSECYRLAAGYALGFINLGKGNDLKGLHDMKLTEKLITHATSTKMVEIVHVLDRAAAGAVIALTLIFMKTEDQIVARKIDVPSSVLQFDYVRPDILLLRTVAKNLILWSKIEPTFTWIQRSLPAPYRARHKLHGTMKLRSTDLPFFSIMAGICFSIALRYSGSASTHVRDLLLHYLDEFMRISSILGTPREHPDAAPLYDEELARANARMCQDVLAVSCAIVMAGTGDIPVLRRLRALHGRTDPDTPYGSHLAAHLAIGALFLGCGTVTFGTSNMAIAALLVAFYPIFPTNVMDNRSHLQAFRHFWVLATEQRCLVAKDILTGQPVSVAVQIKMRQDVSTEAFLHRSTPCLLPPLDQISSLSTHCGPQFWDIELDLSDETVRAAFAKTQSLHLRRRPPREGTFPSTLRALGRDGDGQNPIEWLFDLEGLKGVSYAEKAALLESGEEDPETGAAVDARLEFEKGICEGGDLERLEGARLLFEWGSARDRLRQNDGRPAVADPSTSHDSQETITMRSRRRRSLAEESENEQDDEGNKAVWWMRDSDLEALKGKVWLAAREAEQ
ncbi:20S cyclosome subunit (APC1/BimE), putative [Cordyceps militaris CM01]|uniref:20S cyclosome subunit (APC1/BimE), putative n=1 Tax=Cordyceps militaris (strain CM01) TaxID=983644 RepID=G3J7T1_CORMM|nr:20S cyclosome subunit (APC1/BimE), putative [Cordyceps militaris CM01]EGX96345.1 20S cyclosome subunit (APC1/BimE), putative [Cordyceps militaris CM01]